MQIRETGRSTSSIAIMCVVAAVCQVALSPQISILGGSINFMLVLSCVLSLSSDAPSAVYIGFFSGLFFDLTSAAPIGLMSLLLTVSSFLLAGSSRGALGGLTPDSLRLVVGTMFVVNLVYGLCLFFMGVQSDLLWALLGHGISSTVLDAIVSALFLMFNPSSAPTRSFSARGRGSRYKMTR